MSNVSTLDHDAWSGAAQAAASEAATASLEAGDVLFLPRLRFAIEAGEARLFTPAILGASKNASYDPATGRLGRTTASGRDAEALGAFIRRFSAAAADLVDRILPHYRGHLTRSRASFRPAEIAGRQTTWRKDDTRLHVDSFPATPVQGRRILRVFTNVNPDGRSRTWRIGDDFDNVARRFAQPFRPPLPGSAVLLQLLRVTKSRRTPYDRLMLRLHDRMKADVAYQAHAPQMSFEFPSGTTWMAFTDQVSHAAMAGQYQLEQTFLVPVDTMRDERRSPLRILEHMIGQPLV